MVDELLKIKIWGANVTGRFFKELKNLSNEERCKIIVSTVKELLKRGGEYNISSAEVILIYATQKYFEGVDSNTKAQIYYSLGQLYEHYLYNFIKAYTYYEKYTLNNTLNEGNHSTLLRALILRDDFKYSEGLEKEYNYSLGETDLGLRNDRLYENLGSLIIAKHNENTDEVQKLSKRLKAIVKTDELFFLDIVFKKDAIPDTLRIPQKVIDYINKL